MSDILDTAKNAGISQIIQRPYCIYLQQPMLCYEVCLLPLAGLGVLTGPVVARNDTN
jgi:hypothetical protein